MSADFYETLGVGRTATADEIKKAYRKKARIYHPDVNPGDAGAEKRFKDISEAYQALSDPQKRAQYDQFGQGGPFAGGGAGPQGHGGPGGFESGDFDFSGGTGQAGFGDIFEMFFGGGRRPGGRQQHAPARGQDAYVNVPLTFDDAFRGVTRELNIESPETCAICAGTGAKPGATSGRCPSCSGTGQMSGGRGILKINQTCPACGGSGQSRVEACSACGGAGSRPAMNRISVKIPPGVANDSKIRVPGKGSPGMFGGPQGDLYIVTQVVDHPLFERKGDNLQFEVPITIVEAALGTRLEVPTPEGRSEIKIPPGTDTGKTFRLRGKGFPSLRGSGRGDLYIKVKIVAPKSVSEKDRKILEEFAKSNPEDPRAYLRGYVR